ncbi:hypothetical protein PHYSODRAFT_326998 [Phytophthora sojae]|uniref:Crinkler effector protein N-terminal domain-containing protein n=1 Tax=Phytophthora sojae (strain P6497) TaxID=1094619 RepID=G4YVN3_PHYSP|nr:hypothetical protein PHYSODRAFT_326998 [Phytophthora sojae]EGZ26065.1 hypothetical protein PHYSODRAFT_326998 [Phytophthora sojae]|eukprot:XP_009521353.1 hypothetical protein PHYSODRAFT_326998 [Phytophthora sojae]
MESVTIPCFSVKDGLQFSVEIEPNKFIGSLVKPIAAELESVLKHRKLPADMQLYLARKGGEWLDLAGAKAHGWMLYFEEINPFSSDRYFGGEFRAEGKVLVLVVESALPRLEHKRKLARWINRLLDNHGPTPPTTSTADSKFQQINKEN